MVNTPSTMLPLHTNAPDFALPDAVSGRTFTLDDFKDAPALVVMFICNHCPFVNHVLDGISSLASDLLKRGVAIVAINSNDIEKYPQDAPAQMKSLAVSRGWNFPFLFDEDQKIATSFRAACTPDFYVFDRERRLVYRGQLDDSRPGNNVPVTGRDVRDAVECLLAGRPVPEEQKPSIGCNIKWKPGNAPEYF